MHTGRFDEFVLVSSDSDFARLASRLREQGLQVYGIGKTNTPEAFCKACKRFIFVENLLGHGDEPPEGGKPDESAPPAVRPETAGDTSRGLRRTGTRWRCRWGRRLQTDGSRHPTHERLERPVDVLNEQTRQEGADDGAKAEGRARGLGRHRAGGGGRGDTDKGMGERRRPDDRRTLRGAVRGTRGLDAPIGDGADRAGGRRRALERAGHVRHVAETDEVG